MVKIGVNGFGRIGRLVLRASLKKLKESKCGENSPQVVAINDPYLTVEHMANLFKYDSTHGLFQGNVEVAGKCLVIEDSTIETINEKAPDKIPWEASCCKYVVDCTGLYKTQGKAKAHLRDCVKRVILSYPSGSDVPMFVFGVNQDSYDPDMRIVSNASCTTNCLAPVVKVLHDNFTINHALMLTVHAVTPSQNTLDGPAKKNFRIGRGAYQNIIPSSTGATKAIGRIIPELNGKLTGIAVRVPVPDGSMVDLTCNLEKCTDYEQIKCRIREAADSYMKGILAYTDEEIVSSDIIGDPRSCIFDAGAGLALTSTFVKLVMWYDNEWGYANRIVDLVKYMASRELDN